MINKELIERINFLYNKAQKHGLSDQEKDEQARLRQEYLKGIRAQVKQTLDRAKLSQEDTESCHCGHDHPHKH